MAPFYFNYHIVKEKFFTCVLWASSLVAGVCQLAGNALHFDGDNDYVTATVPTVFTNTAANDFTIEAWVYPQGNALSRVLFSQYTTSNIVSFTLSSTNSVYLYVVSGSNTYGKLTYASLPANQWSHVAITWKASTKVTTIYFNGIAQNGTTSIGTTSMGTNSVMTLGARSDAGGGQFFKGALDDVRIWNHIRTNCEILANKNTSLSGTENGLVSLYTFNQGSGGQTNTPITTLTNEVAAAPTGTLTNFALTGSTSNWITSAAAISQQGLQTAITVYQSVSLCSGGSYTFPDGTTQNNITSSVSHTSSFTASNLCDSAVVTAITVLPTYAAQQNVQVCSGSGYTFPDGTTQNNLTSPVSHISHFTSVSLCDSSITTVVSILAPYATQQQAQVCYGASYTFPDGTTQNNITAASSHDSQLSAINGCDSIVTTQVTVNAINTAVTQNGTQLSAVGSGTYQWINCATSSPILGANSQSYTATSNGSYAVVVTSGNCSDTSACYQIGSLSIDEFQQYGISLYPNPNDGKFVVSLTDETPNVELKIVDVSGKVLVTRFYAQAKHISMDLNMPAGLYWLVVRLSTGDQKAFHFVKQ